MKKLHRSYLSAIFFRVVEKRSFVPRLAAFLIRAHASCKESFKQSPYIQTFIAPFHIHIGALLFVTRPFLRAY